MRRWIKTGALRVLWLEVFYLPMNTQKMPLWLEILKLAAPLILSMTGLVLMQFVDALFLAWHSADAIAAVVPAGMASFLIISPFQGTAGYSATFVAHYVGAGRPLRAFAATWQGTYFAIAAGVLISLVGFFAVPLFRFVGHSPGVQILEAQYFSLMCWGALTATASSSLSGYFSGRGETRTLMIVQLAGFAINALLDYVLIFGKWGMPQWGISGAAIATIAAQAFNTLALLSLFLLSEQRKAWGNRHFERELFVRLIRFGFPNGLRFGLEMLAWTLFVFVVGRNGTTELAASGIAFRINGFAFFPIIGLSQAVCILVGQAQGRQDPDHTVRVTHQGLYMAEVWMIFSALLFVLFPREIFQMFRGDGYAPDQFATIATTGVILLRFVALYSLLDACNIIYVGALQSAGDTKWTLLFSLILHVLFLGVLVGADLLKLGLWWQWGLATLFVMVSAVTWIFRFRFGAWRSIRVIEPVGSVADS